MRGRPNVALVASLLLAGIATMPVHAAAPRDCVKAEVVLWGDGRHDDTAALNAWLHGADAVWGADGTPVGSLIAEHSFRLSAAVYVAAGTGRTLRDFRLVFPERHETVTGGTIAAGDDPDRAPAMSGVEIAGGDPGEGKPFDLPDPKPAAKNTEESCATS